MGSGGAIRMSDLPDASARRNVFPGAPFDNDELGLRIASKNLHDVVPSGSWKGRRCFLVGGGTSLKGFDFSKLNGELVIAINRAMEFLPNSSIMFCQDARLWGWYEDGSLGKEAKEKFESFKGFRTWLNTPNFPFPENIYTIPCTNVRDFNWPDYNYSQGLPFCSSSGMSALCLAVCLGADPIYLLGFDLYGEGGKSADFHGGYPDTPNSKDLLYKESMLPNFELFAENINKVTKIINLNPKSELKCFQFGDFKDIKFTKKPLITGCYTKNTPYELEIKRLEKSLIRFGFEYYFEGLNSLGDWRKNVHQKVEFVQRCMNKFDRDIIQMDSDVELMHYPVLFDSLGDYDVGVHVMPEENHVLGGEKVTFKDMTNVSVLYLKNTPATKKLVDAWVEEDATLRAHIDDISFGDTLKKFPDLKVLRLPDEYCHIYDRPTDKEPIIELYQANRRHRKAVNTANRVLFTSFFTKNTEYEKISSRLVNSMEKFNIYYDVVAVDNTGDWGKNTKQKPLIIKRMLEKYPYCNVVFVDTDAEFMKRPEFFDKIETDIGILHIIWSKHFKGNTRIQLATGTIFLQNTMKVRGLVDAWIEKCKDSKYPTDQEALEALLEERRDITITELPEEYVFIDFMKNVTDPVIKHHQASRTLKDSPSINLNPEEKIILSEKRKYEQLWLVGYIPSQCAGPMAVAVVAKAQKEWSILDLGCGDGTTVKALRNQGFNCQGVDITGVGIKFMDKDKWFKEGTLWKLPYKDKQFDFTFSTDVLEHMPTDKVNDTIKEILRVTKYGTFHCIAIFADVRHIGGKDIVLHHTVQKIEWWRKAFDELNKNKIKIELIDREEFLGLAKMQALGVA
jgi:SAM-dependent methyltransferase